MLSQQDILIAKAAAEFLTPELARRVLSCLHPDSRRSTSDKKLAEVFDAFRKVEQAMRS
jgi:hypothetical protein